MNLIVLFEHDFINIDTVKLCDHRFEHIRSIHQSTAGDYVKVGKLNGLIGIGQIQSINDNNVEITVDLQQPPPAKLPLTIILALPRPKMIRRIFRSIAELGVEQLVVINSYKVEKSFWKSPALEEEKINQYLIAGLQQAKDTQLPTVSFKRLFKPFVEDELGQLLSAAKGFIAHPNTATPCPQPYNQPAVIAIGPEGGFTDYEVDKFLAAGFEGVHLGQRILRVENALTALTSKLFTC